MFASFNRLTDFSIPQAQAAVKLFRVSRGRKLEGRCEAAQIGGGKQEVEGLMQEAERGRRKCVGEVAFFAWEVSGCLVKGVWLGCR
mgnify:CR=1 FL=1